MEKPRHVRREAGLLFTFDSPSETGLVDEVILVASLRFVPVRPIADHCTRARSSGPCPRAAARAGQFPGGVMAPPLAVDPRRSWRWARNVERGAHRAKNTLYPLQRQASNKNLVLRGMTVKRLPEATAELELKASATKEEEAVAPCCENQCGHHAPGRRRGLASGDSSARADRAAG